MIGKENVELKKQIETTQKAVDSILLGGEQ